MTTGGTYDEPLHINLRARSLGGHDLDLDRELRRLHRPMSRGIYEAEVKRAVKMAIVSGKHTHQRVAVYVLRFGIPTLVDDLNGRWQHEVDWDVYFDCK